MKATRVAASLVAIAAIGFFASCDDSSSSSSDTNTNPNTNPGTNSGGVDLVSTANIVTTGATTAKMIEHDTDAYCTDDELTVNIDHDTSTFSIQTISGKDYIVPEEADLDTAILGGKVVEMNGRWVRIGSGSGFTGRWEPETRVLTGVSNARLENSMHADSARIVFGSSTASMIAYGIHMGMITGAWAKGMTNMRNVTTSISSDSTTVTMKAKSETVTLRFGFEGDNMKQTWSSSNPSHATYVVYDRPKSCPDEEMPSWFEDFMMNAAMGN